MRVSKILAVIIKVMSVHKKVIKVMKSSNSLLNFSAYFQLKQRPMVPTATIAYANVSQLLLSELLLHKLVPLNDDNGSFKLLLS